MRKRAASYRSAQTSIKHGDEAIIFRQNIVTTSVWWRGVSYLKSLFTKHFSLYFIFMLELERQKNPSGERKRNHFWSSRISKFSEVHFRLVYSEFSPHQFTHNFKCVDNFN